ncbi:hypothetical protein HYPDE_23093 [Hyphomicrobium denitrificans 1NES1]|uniref:Uncharacterized protein n=1 Tax=Hyphomicrobium denitrificans 1NES1 TaxID=670307 RepID=N0B8B6_9HYPH|nr:hypothetical protein HYPDE_23093 [Hyphomicrobium denitrificans 1NES1]
MALKVSDEFTVPLCTTHHDQLHRSGDERAFWVRNGVSEPLKHAARLWKLSHQARQAFQIQRRNSVNPVYGNINRRIKSDDMGWFHSVQESPCIRFGSLRSNDGHWAAAECDGVPDEMVFTVRAAMANGIRRFVSSTNISTMVRATDRRIGPFLPLAICDNSYFRLSAITLTAGKHLFPI